MQRSMLHYFCDSYLLMTDYGMTLEEVILDFSQKETKESIQSLKEECNRVLETEGENRERKIRNIITAAADLNVDVEEMEEILIAIVSTM